MTEPAIVSTILDEPMDFTVFANNPADMVGAQRSMILWCARKIQAEKTEMAEAQANLDAAKAHKWSPTAWAKQVKLRADKIEFYKKVKAALEAGYYIVPPFPVDTFAIRVKDGASPKGNWTESGWHRFEQAAKMLPAGEGQYVSPRPTREVQQFPKKKTNGSVVQIDHYRPMDFTAADFPFKLAKAEIMEATRAAMALKVFDRMGALPAARAPDPIICGEILLPHRKGQAVTFFVSWWLDTKTL
jgi:hypothetical protein